MRPRLNTTVARGPASHLFVPRMPIPAWVLYVLSTASKKARKATPIVMKRRSGASVSQGRRRRPTVEDGRERVTLSLEDGPAGWTEGGSVAVSGRATVSVSSGALLFRSTSAIWAISIKTPSVAPASSMLDGVC